MTTETTVRWQGAEQLRGLLVPVDSVKPHPDNPRRGKIELIVSSLLTFGQQRAILVQESTGYIVAGNHTYIASSYPGLEWTHIAAVVEDMSDEKAGAYLLADNHTADVGTYDDKELTRLLQRHADEGTLELTTYTADELDTLLSKQGGKQTEEEQFLGGYAADDPGWKEGGGGREGQQGPMKEVTLMMPQEQHEEFARWLTMLRREWQTTGVLDTVLRALRSCAEQL